MERRVLLAIALSFVVLYAYQALFVPPTPVKPPAAQGARSTPETSAQTEPVTAEPAVAPETTPAPAAAALVADAAVREVVVETTSLRAVFSNRGARIVKWQLKDYRDADGTFVDLVPSNIPERQPTPFSLRVEDEDITRRLHAAVYRIAGAQGDKVDATTAPATVSFEFEDSAGLRVRKEFTFQPSGYVVAFSASVRDGERTLNPQVQWGPGLGDVGALSSGGSYFSGNYVQPPQAIYHRDGDVERISADDILEQPVHEGTFRFVGVDDHYFLASAINPGQARVDYATLALPASGDTPSRQLLAHTYAFAKPPQGVKFYFGPKAFDVLKAADGELVRAIHFGVFAWLAVPMLGALKWIYGFVGNYGWSIVLLTILINLAIFPLRHKSVVSMRKMQQLQPQLKAIQERYANLKVTDPARQKMNTEIMNLYREKGVNPASGCVPMLLTMPVLFAFYSLLSQAVELRGAEFGWWIRDLSQHDPYYVTPVLMGATMFWQQKITPTTADPTQQRIMLIMPLLFSFMFLWAPSGLVIYWFISNLWAIGQQYFTNWLIGPPPVHVVRPPAERRLKNVGAGRSHGATGKQ